MNKKIFTTMLILCCSFLFTFNILKFAFPEKFLLCLTNSEIEKIGNFISSDKIITEIYYYITAFISLYLFTCCCCGKLYLSFKETLFVVVGTIALDKARKQEMLEKSSIKK